MSRNSLYTPRPAAAQRGLFGAAQVSLAMDEARASQPAQGSAGITVPSLPPPDNRPRMPWGVHANKPLDEVPDKFMRLCLNTPNIAARLPAWLELEFKTRLGLIQAPEPIGKAIPLNELRGLIKRHYFTMSRQLHPDAGGDAKSMATLSIVHDSIKAALTEWEKTH